MATSKDGRMSIFDVVSGERRSKVLPASTVRKESCEPTGSHYITRSPCGRFLIVGTFNPANAALLDCETLQPRKLFLNGHDDWIFDAQFVNHYQFITGGRDGKIALWDIRDSHGETVGNQLPFTQPRVIKPAHRTRTRCVSRLGPADHGLQRFVTCSPNELLRVWDLNTVKSIQKFNVSRLNEIMSMAIHDNSNLVALGHYNGVAIFSLSPASVLRQLDSVPNGPPLFSVRSLSWQGDTLVIGSGNAILCFYDYKAEGFLQVTQVNVPFRNSTPAVSPRALVPLAPRARPTINAQTTAATTSRLPDPGSVSRSATANQTRQSASSGDRENNNGIFLPATNLLPSGTRDPFSSAPSANDNQNTIGPRLLHQSVASGSVSLQGSEVSEAARGNRRAEEQDPRHRDTASSRPVPFYSLASRRLPSELTSHFSISRGVVHRDRSFRHWFSSDNPDIALYTHSWSPSYTMLFVGGGPLASNASGCYASILRP